MDVDEPDAALPTRHWPTPPINAIPKESSGCLPCVQLPASQLRLTVGPLHPSTLSRRKAQGVYQLASYASFPRPLLPTLLCDTDSTRRRYPEGKLRVWGFYDHNADLLILSHLCLQALVGTRGHRHVCHQCVELLQRILVVVPLPEQTEHKVSIVRIFVYPIASRA